MPIWTVESIQDRPNVSLIQWKVYEIPLSGEDQPWTRHLVGWCCEDRHGQVSSSIRAFDPMSGQFVTRSGRRYKLLGAPGTNEDAAYVWGHWKSRSRVDAERDVTSEVVEAMRQAQGIDQQPKANDQGDGDSPSNAQEQASFADLRQIHTFDELTAFLHEPQHDPNVISPKRWLALMGISATELATQVDVSQNTLHHSPKAPAVQHLLRQALSVIEVAADLADDVQSALRWYRTERLDVFRGETAERLVARGRSADVLNYLVSLRAGGLG